MSFVPLRTGRGLSGCALSCLRNPPQYPIAQGYDLIQRHMRGRVQRLPLPGGAHARSRYDVYWMERHGGRV
jgi:hypothetical protein